MPGRHEHRPSHPLVPGNAGGTHCGVEQLAARRVHTPEVAGSSPAPATTSGWSRGMTRDSGSRDGGSTPSPEANTVPRGSCGSPPGRVKANPTAPQRPSPEGRFSCAGSRPRRVPIPHTVRTIKRRTARRWGCGGRWRTNKTAEFRTSRTSRPGKPAGRRRCGATTRPNSPLPSPGTHGSPRRRTPPRRACSSASRPPRDRRGPSSSRARRAQHGDRCA